MLEAILTVLATAALGFIAWLVCKVLDMERKLVELEARIIAREKDCEHHHEWMDVIDTKLNKVCEDAAFVRGKMGG